MSSSSAPNATGTWDGSASGFKFTLVLTQNGDTVSGTLHVGGFSKPGHLTGTNQYPAQPNLQLTGTWLGIKAGFSGNFNGNNEVDGTVSAQGKEFPLVVNRAPAIEHAISCGS